MSLHQKKSANIGNSNSLWTASLSPGWTKEEAEILKVFLMLYGVGKWTALDK